MKKILASSFLLVILTASCSKDDRETVSERTAVSIESVSVPTKGFATESADTVGLTLMESGKKPYNGRTSGYSNVKYIKKAGEETWGTDSPIMISSTPGVLYAYYPYSASVSDIREIPVRSSLNGTDYMYADSVTNVNSLNPSVSLILHHALARLTVRIWKDSIYDGGCEFNGISISGNGVAISGTLDATDGTITAVPAVLQFTTDPVSFASDTMRADFLIVPALVSAERQEVTLICSIDGKDYEVPLKGDNGVVMEPGKNSSVSLSMNGNTGFLSVVSVGVEEWNAGDGSTSDVCIVPGGLIVMEKDDCQNGGEIVL